MKATALLRKQHRMLRRLLAHVGGDRLGPVSADMTAPVSADKTRRVGLMLQLVEELMTHLAIEDRLFLNSIADAMGIGVEKYRGLQAGVRNAVLQAVFVEDDDNAFAVRLRELEAAFQRHACALERDLLPIVETQVEGDRLEVMGARMQVLWQRSVSSAARARSAPSERGARP